MALKQVKTTCAYCGAGCQIEFTVDTARKKIVGEVPALVELIQAHIV